MNVQGSFCVIRKLQRVDKVLGENIAYIFCFGFSSTCALLFIQLQISHNMWQIHFKIWPLTGHKSNFFFFFFTLHSFGKCNFQYNFF